MRPPCLVSGAPSARLPHEWKVPERSFRRERSRTSLSWSMCVTQKVLVTGGAGFIGLKLLRSLAQAGYQTTILDNLHPQVHGEGGVVPDLPEGTVFVRGDVRDDAAIRAVVDEAQPDLIVHLAAETGTGQSWDEVSRYCDVNVGGTARLVEALRRLPEKAGWRRRLILASSRAIYGEGAYTDATGIIVAPPPRLQGDMEAGRFDPMQDGIALVPAKTREDLPLTPASIYASTKLMQEFILQQALTGTDIDLVILRFQNVYGPGQSLKNPYTGVLSIFSEQIMRGQMLNIFEDGEITRDFVFVEDVVDAILTALDHPDAPGAVCNIGSGEAATIRAVAQELVTLLGVADYELRISGMFRAGDVRHAVADITLARDRLGWSPKTTLSSGLAQLVDWVHPRSSAGRQ